MKTAHQTAEQIAVLADRQEIRNLLEQATKHLDRPMVASLTRIVARLDNLERELGNQALSDLERDLITLYRLHRSIESRKPRNYE